MTCCTEVKVHVAQAGTGGRRDMRCGLTRLFSFSFFVRGVGRDRAEACHQTAHLFLFLFFSFYFFLRPAFDWAAAAPSSPVFFSPERDGILAHSCVIQPFRALNGFALYFVLLLGFRGIPVGPIVVLSARRADRPRVRSPGAGVAQIARARGGEGAGWQTARRRRARGG